MKRGKKETLDFSSFHLNRSRHSNECANTLLSESIKTRALTRSRHSNKCANKLLSESMKRRALNRSHHSNESIRMNASKQQTETKRTEPKRSIPSFLGKVEVGEPSKTFPLSFPFFEQSLRESDSYEGRKESLPTMCSMISDQKYQPTAQTAISQQHQHQQQLRIRSCIALNRLV
jgi:hypothetical protein